MNLARALILSLAIDVLPQFAFAADGQSTASKSATRLDDDFYLQGEYAGSLVSADGTCTTTGLQVIALGDGKFRAVEYAGGLPGNGGDWKNRQTYPGEKNTAGFVEFKDNRRRLIVQPRLLVVKDDAGKTLGRLPRIQRTSRTLRAPPPADSKVLFYGRDARQFAGGFVTPDHLLVAGADTKEPFGDFTLHLEFRTPYMPQARGQARGNSGVYIQGRYEVQILDSFGLEGADNECGSLYKQRAPLVNMCFPPLAWQTYDIDFTAPRFDKSGKKTTPARITVRLNGIVVQKDVEITAKTGAGAAEGPDPRPLRLQDHGDPVHFRNIWIVEREASTDLCACPTIAGR